MTLLYSLLLFLMGLGYWLAALLSRTWDLLLAGVALWLCWWAARHREASRSRRRNRLLVAGVILLFLYLPPFGARLETPDLAQYFEPGVAHAEPTFIRGENAVYVQIPLKTIVPPWFASTYLKNLEQRGIEIDPEGTSPYAPLPHQTGWTIRGVREIGTDPYTVEHFTSYVRGVSPPASLRWPWLYLRLGPDFFSSFRRSVVVPKDDATPLHLGAWRYPGAVATWVNEQEPYLGVRFVAPARRAQILDYYRSFLGDRYRMDRHDDYQTSFARGSESKTDLSPPHADVQLSESVWYCYCEAPSIYSTDAAERRRREPPPLTAARRSQQSVLLPHLPLLTEYELRLSYQNDASGRYGFARTFEPELSRRLDAIALRKGLPAGDLTDDGSLGRFAARSGVVAFFRQRTASDYDAVPRQSQETLRVRGSDESKSRYINSARLDRFHPIVSSVVRPVFSIMIDGVIDQLPQGAVVLLRSVRDGDLPALVLFRVEKGWAAVGTVFAFNEEEYGPQSKDQTGGIEIVRDLITWAKDPDRPIPVVSPGETVRLSIEVFNRSRRPARFVKLRTWTPSRDRVEEERETPLLVGPGARGLVNYRWLVPADAPLGIHHVDFELLNESRQTLQPEAETMTGRFAVAAPEIRARGGT